MKLVERYGFTWLLAAALLLIAACNDDNGTKPEEYNPVIKPEDFVGSIDNEYLPLVPGTTFIYEGESEGQNQRTETAVTANTKVILGVTCVEVHDQVFAGEELIEDTFDWYAQDKDGNVWYFGEDTEELENGEVVSTEGSWEAGVDGAKPGIVMKGTRVVGDVYRQEFLEGEAEDMGEILSIDETVTIGLGVFTNCVETKEWSPLEPGVIDHKHYAPGIGSILEETVAGGDEQFELVEITAK